MRRLVPFGIGLVVVAFLCVPKLRAQEKEGGEAKAKGWTYPDAKVMSSSESDSLYTAVSTTANDLDKVLKHYEMKFGTKMVVATPSAGGAESREGKTTSAHHDSFQPHDGKEYRPRAVTLCIFAQNTKFHSVTVMVSRVKGESHTHIALTYVQK